MKKINLLIGTAVTLVVATSLTGCSDLTMLNNIKIQ